ncbi:MAG: SRPBCC family protein [Prevotella sp.]|nr:SRPBCC family protein [Prevotella sp.]
MSKFESSIKQIPYSQAAVYRCISNLENLERVRDRVPEDKVKDFRFDHDSVSVNVAPVGELTMRIINREEPKCVKFEAEKSPIPFNLWIQVLPVTETSSKMKLTLEADINPFIKGMVSGPLKDGIEKIADALAMVPYE